MKSKVSYIIQVVDVDIDDSYFICSEYLEDEFPGGYEGLRLTAENMDNGFREALLPLFILDYADHGCAEYSYQEFETNFKFTCSGDDGWANSSKQIIYPEALRANAQDERDFFTARGLTCGALQ